MDLWLLAASFHPTPMPHPTILLNGFLPLRPGVFESSTRLQVLPYLSPKIWGSNYSNLWNRMIFLPYGPYTYVSHIQFQPVGCIFFSAPQLFEWASSGGSMTSIDCCKPLLLARHRWCHQNLPPCWAKRRRHRTLPVHLHAKVYRFRKRCNVQ